MSTDNFQGFVLGINYDNPYKIKIIQKNYIEFKIHQPVFFISLVIITITHIILHFCPYFTQTLMTVAYP